MGCFLLFSLLYYNFIPQNPKKYSYFSKENSLLENFEVNSVIVLSTAVTQKVVLLTAELTGGRWLKAASQLPQLIQ